VVADRAAGLDDRAHAVLGRRVDAVAERKERVRCERGSLNLQPRFGGLQRADACAHYAARLARADPERRAASRVDDRVRLHELHDGPSEGEIGELLCAWLTARDDLRRRDVYASV